MCRTLQRDPRGGADAGEVESGSAGLSRSDAGLPWASSADQLNHSTNRSRSSATPRTSSDFAAWRAGPRSSDFAAVGAGRRTMPLSGRDARPCRSAGEYDRVQVIRSHPGYLDLVVFSPLENDDLDTGETRLQSSG
jgi:hypothetical protein